MKHKANIVFTSFWWWGLQLELWWNTDQGFSPQEFHILPFPLAYQILPLISQIVHSHSFSLTLSELLSRARRRFWLPLNTIRRAECRKGVPSWSTDCRNSPAIPAVCFTESRAPTTGYSWTKLRPCPPTPTGKSSIPLSLLQFAFVLPYGWIICSHQ
jgi:hypothetical protein